MLSNQDDSPAAHTADGSGLQRYTRHILCSIAAALLFSDGVPMLFGQQTLPSGLTANQATELANLMCRQLPNLTSVRDAIVTLPSPNNPSIKKGPKERFVWDDVYDTLVELGAYSVPCLVDRLTDTQWTPDPRMEPLLGVPVVGDVAYMVLTDKGVPDLLPTLAHKDCKKMTMDDWFVWPTMGDNRLQLQNAVRAWWLKHPQCCGVPQGVDGERSSNPIFRMSTSQLAQAQTRFAHLRPGMTVAQVLNDVGKPHGVDSSDESDRKSADIHLLGFCSPDRHENRACIYFVERWTKDIQRRDPLRDRYVILFFSATGAMTRMFSNVAEIPPSFPASQSAWYGVMWGATDGKK